MGSVLTELDEGDIDVSACPVRYTFGQDGKPLYINGPYETAAQQRTIIDNLMRRLGPDGFDYILQAHETA